MAVEDRYWLAMVRYGVIIVNSYVSRYDYRLIDEIYRNTGSWDKLVNLRYCTNYDADGYSCATLSVYTQVPHITPVSLVSLPY